MKHILTRSLSRILLVCMVVSMCSNFATAAYNPPDNPDSSHYLDGYTAGMTPKGNGVVSVTVDVTAVVNATMLGACDIYVYEGTAASGVLFNQVAHFNYEDYPKMMGSGLAYLKSPVQYSGTAGRYYMAYVVFYAGDSTGYDTRGMWTYVIQAT